MLHNKEGSFYISIQMIGEKWVWHWVIEKGLQGKHQTEKNVQKGYGDLRESNVTFKLTIIWKFLEILKSFI